MGRVWKIIILAATCPYGQTVAGVEEIKIIKDSLSKLGHTILMHSRELSFCQEALAVDWNESRLKHILNGSYVFFFLFFYFFLFVFCVLFLCGKVMKNSLKNLSKFFMIFYVISCIISFYLYF